MTWNEPTWFIAGLFLVTLAGALLPIRLDRREDHIVVTIAAATAAAILGLRGLLLLWAAAAAVTPIIFAIDAFGPSRSRRPPRASLRSVAWVLVSAFACTVGFLLGNVVYAGMFSREYPIAVGTASEVLLAGGVGFVSWLGTMGMRVLSQKAISGSVTVRGLDPFDSMVLPYLVPLLGGFPLITAAVALYHPEDPFGSLFILWWCFPLYVATAFDLRKRKMALELRRDAFARQRLAAIGEVSARIVHQSRHQVGLMAWSIHRLRGVVGQPDGVDVAAMQEELDALTEAKDRLSAMLAAELLHETTTLADGAHESAPESLVDVVGSVAALLRAEAASEGVTLSVEVAPADGSRNAPTQLHDVIFNLVDNAIDAAASQVIVRLCEDAGPEGTAEISVIDDGTGLVDLDPDRAFEPFFTTKQNGTGMGLAIADALVGDLGGALRYERTADHTAFVVTLPPVR